MIAFISICLLETEKIYVDANMNETKENIEGYCHSTSLHGGWINFAQWHNPFCAFSFIGGRKLRYCCSAMQAILQKCVASSFTSSIIYLVHEKKWYKLVNVYLTIRVSQLLQREKHLQVNIKYFQLLTRFKQVNLICKALV